jgi:hypothetical protein
MVFILLEEKIVFCVVLRLDFGDFPTVLTGIEIVAKLFKIGYFA